MHLNDFVAKNQLNIGNFIIKGYCFGKEVYNNIEYDGILIYLVSIRKKQYNRKVFKILHNDNDILYFLEDKESFDLDKSFTYNKCIKPLGYLQTDVLCKDNSLISNAFFINEDLNFTFDILNEDRFYEVATQDFLKNIDEICFVPDEMIVHSGKMHADDILSAALAKYVNKDIKIYRLRDIPTDFKGLVADVGRGRYDHHDGDKPRLDPETNEQYINKNNKPEFYAAFGLLAKDILPGYLGEKGYEILDEQYIRELDDADNNGSFSSFARMLEFFNPTWNSNESEDVAFMKAVDIALVFIERMIAREKAKTDAVPYVLSKLKVMKNNILLLDKPAPWQGLARKSDAIVCIYPVEEGWAIQCVQSNNVDVKENCNKISLPKEWLEREDIVFCHNSLHFAIFKTQKEAIINAKIAIQNDINYRYF